MKINTKKNNKTKINTLFLRNKMRFKIKQKFWFYFAFYLHFISFTF